MRITRALRLLGYLLIVLVLVPDVIGPHEPWHGRRLAWLYVYGVFALAFHVGASAPETARARRLGALAVMSPAMIAMAALQPCHFGALSLVVVASQAALVLDLRQTLLVIALQTVGLGYILACSEWGMDAFAEIVALLGFEVFAAVAVWLARRAAEATRALAYTNAELRATRSLLEETSRVHERTRIARELHDVLGHDLTALGLQLEVATHVGDGKAGQHVQKAQEVSTRLLRNVREVVTAMRDAPGPDLASALRMLADGVPGMHVHLDMPGALCVDDAARAHCVLRCVQEIITNALRHARAENLWITITEKDGAISFDARDDGRGAERVTAGCGLSGMRARIEEMGGSLRVAAEPSRAFVVSAWLPARGDAS
jgi:signal transduction histidine kinase